MRLVVMIFVVVAILAALAGREWWYLNSEGEAIWYCSLANPVDSFVTEIVGTPNVDSVIVSRRATGDAIVAKIYFHECDSLFSAPDSTKTVALNMNRLEPFI